MSVPRQNPLFTWRRRLHNTLEGLTLMGAAEQTRLSWAKPVRSADEIPEAYHAYLQANLLERSACLPAVLTPTFRGFLRRENEKLVFIHDEHLYILEQTPAGLLPLVFPFAGTNYVEVGGILLKAWVRVNGLIDGELVTATLKYNSVTQHLFDPLVAQIRRFQSGGQARQGVSTTDQAQPTPEPVTQREPDQAQKPFILSDLEGDRRASDHREGEILATTEMRLEQAKFDSLRTGHFKFMNYARRSLQPGERVVAYTLQPELRQPRLSLLGRPLSLHTLETAHLCILTDRELIVIRDDPNSLKDYAQSRYGGIWDYLPLSRIQSATLEERPAGHLALVVHLPGGDRMEILFSTEKRLELEQVCARLEAVTPAP
jgi:hypothetical protein